MDEETARQLRAAGDRSHRPDVFGVPVADLCRVLGADASSSVRNDLSWSDDEVTP